MAADVPHLRQDRPVAEQGVYAVGPRRTKRGIKISRRGIKSKPACRVKPRQTSLTVSIQGTVGLPNEMVTVSIRGTHIVYHRGTMRKALEYAGDTARFSGAGMFTRMLSMLVLSIGLGSTAFAMDNIEADAAYEREIKEQIRGEFTEGLRMLKAQADKLGMEAREKDFLTLQQHMYDKAILMARCVDKAITLKKAASGKIALDKYMAGCVETHLKFMGSYGREKSPSLKCWFAGKKYGLGSGNGPETINPPYDFLGFKGGALPPSATDYVTIKDCLDNRSDMQKWLDKR